MLKINANLNRQLKVISVVAGKSGGHIIPGIVIANNEVQKLKYNKVIFFTSSDALDRSIIDNTNFEHVPLVLENFPRKNWLNYPRFLYHFVKSIICAYIALYKNRTAKLISIGGYISIPVCVAAKLLSIPIDIYELNLIPGKAVKLLNLFANNTFICFDETLEHFVKKSNCTRIEYPLKFSKKDVVSATVAKRKLGIDSTKKVLLILGGSQGSVFINETVADFIKTKSEQLKKFYVVHQTGIKDFQKIKEFYENLSISASVFNYINSNLNYFYSAADLIITRAGAGSLFEISLFQKKSIIIPLVTNTTDHQIENAFAMQKKYPELFDVALEEQITVNYEKFYNEILQILH